MKTRARLLAAATLAAAIGAAAAPAVLAQTPPPAADTMFRATTLNLAATGEVMAKPDMATITLGVTTEAATAQAAMQANAQKMSQVTAALRRAGVEEKDIQTSNLNLNPQHQYGENQPPRITGYQASNQVTVTVRDLARLGPAVDATVNAGANQVHGISFGLADPTEAEDAARLDAVRQLAAKAQTYAGATGHRVSRLVMLSEGGGYQPQPPMPMMMMERSMAKDASTPVSPGEMKVRIEVTGLYELAR